MGIGLKHGTKMARDWTGKADSYVDPKVPWKLPTPVELVNKDLHIKMLQEDLARTEQVVCALRNNNRKLKNRVVELQQRLAREGATQQRLPTVADVRTQKGLSGAELARRIGVSSDSYNKRERGQIRWRRCYVEKVCEVLGVKEDKVWWGEIIE